MQQKRLLFILIASLGVSTLAAGDTATFVDLGFSQDSRIFVFAQYGVQAGTLRPWAELFVVDVERNNFVSGGRISYVHDVPVIFGQDGSGVFHSILVRNAPLLQTHQVYHTLQGRPLFIALDDTDSGEIEFRDFQTGASYRAELVQTVEGSGASLESSFFINVRRLAEDGTENTFVVGTPQFRRPLVASYRIRQVRVFGDAVIFVIEMQRQDGGAASVRFMVEALRRTPF